MISNLYRVLLLGIIVTLIVLVSVNVRPSELPSMTHCDKCHQFALLGGCGSSGLEYGGVFDGRTYLGRH